MNQVEPELVDILVCPETRKKVSLVDKDMVVLVNRAIAEGRINNVGGMVVNEPIQDGLLREDKKILYPIRDAIPVMLIKEGISMQQLGLEDDIFLA